MLKMINEMLYKIFAVSMTKADRLLFCLGFLNGFLFLYFRLFYKQLTAGRNR